jgi:hypothetical protein
MLQKLEAQDLDTSILLRDMVFMVYIMFGKLLKIERGIFRKSRDLDVITHFYIIYIP